MKLCRSWFPAVPALVLLLAPAAASAWGVQGHSLVAAVADRHLSDRARALVHGILGDDPIYDPAISSWADSLRDSRSRPLHYVNIPLGASYDERRDCPRGCAVTAIPWAANTLRDPRASATDRADALRWLVHLVGDLHQPLHAGDGLDRGGNEIRVRIGRRKEPTNLHHVWDTEVVKPLLTSHAPVPAVAAALDESVSAGQREAWTRVTDPVAWANESHAEARSIYNELGIRPGEGSIIQLPRGYERAQEPRVAAAIERAGLRLARLLNDIAAGAAATAQRR